MLLLLVVLRRLGRAQRTEATVTSAVDAACDELRTPSEGMSAQDGDKLRAVADTCQTLLDSHGDSIEEGLVSADPPNKRDATELKTTAGAVDWALPPHAAMTCSPPRVP